MTKECNPETCGEHSGVERRVSNIVVGAIVASFFVGGTLAAGFIYTKESHADSKEQIKALEAKHDKNAEEERRKAELLANAITEQALEVKGLTVELRHLNNNMRFVIQSQQPTVGFNDETL